MTSSMNPWTRELLLKVYNGEQRNLPFLYHIVNHRGLVPMLEALISKGYTGQVLAEIIQNKCKNEPLAFIKFCLKLTQNVNSPKAPKIGPGGVLQ
jgi:hypothetical protein